MTKSDTRFGIIRHAPTLWNEAKRIQGQENSPLSPRGMSLADEWGRELKDFSWDGLLCSDLGRVHQTVERVNATLGLPVLTDPRLREQDWGTWTGKTLEELKTRDREQLRGQERKGWDFRPPGGESRSEVLQRSLESLADAHTSHPGRNILVVCHEGVIKCLLYRLLGRRFLPDEPKVLQGYYLHFLVMRDTWLTLDTLNALERATHASGNAG